MDKEKNINNLIEHLKEIKAENVLMQNYTFQKEAMGGVVNGVQSWKIRIEVNCDEIL